MKSDCKTCIVDQHQLQSKILCHHCENFALHIPDQQPEVDRLRKALSSLTFQSRQVLGNLEGFARRPLLRHILDAEEAFYNLHPAEANDGKE